MEYLGNNTFKLYLSTKTLELSTDEVCKIIEEFSDEIDFEKIDKVNSLIRESFKEGKDRGVYINGDYEDGYRNGYADCEEGYL